MACASLKEIVDNSNVKFEDLDSQQLILLGTDWTAFTCSGMHHRVLTLHHDNLKNTFLATFDESHYGLFNSYT